jgi:hypothetical protein
LTFCVTFGGEYEALGLHSHRVQHLVQGHATTRSTRGRGMVRRLPRAKIWRRGDRGGDRRKDVPRRGRTTGASRPRTPPGTRTPPPWALFNGDDTQIPTQTRKTTVRAEKG